MPHGVGVGDSRSTRGVACHYGARTKTNVTLPQIRSAALELSAEVIGNSAARSGKPGAYFLTPVVRYYIDGKRYEAEIANATFGRPTDVGSSMTILVSPDSPYSPMDPYGGLGATLRGAIITAVLSTLLVGVHVNVALARFP